MKTKVLLEKIKEFRGLLKEHYDLWGKSLNDIIPSYPIKNRDKLKEQQIQLHKLFYQLDDYLTNLAKDV